MNEKKIIFLRDYIKNAEGWGKEQGKELFNHLLDVIDSNPEISIFTLSLQNIKRMDVSFPRESIMEVARRFRGTKGFCLIDIENTDVYDNLDSAAVSKEQPIIIWTKTGYSLIGPVPPTGLKDTFDYVLSKDIATATEISENLTLKLTNASSKLKQLVIGGYLLRKEESSPSGGKEYKYFRMK